MDQRQGTRELIRYAVSRKMFCQCGVVLDCRSAYLISYAIPGERRTFVCCTSCAKDTFLPVLKDQAQLDGTVSTWGRGELPITIRKPETMPDAVGPMIQQDLDI